MGHDARYWSQNGEDEWLDRHFHRKAHGFYVEVGAYDGVNLSNTRYFEGRGWTGILIEPDPVMADRCRQSRPRSKTFQCAAGAPGAEPYVTFHRVAGGEAYSSTTLDAAHQQRLGKMGLEWQSMRVPQRTLDSILEEVSPPAIDFVSIDVEGGELAVLQGFDLARWKPGVVLVENNAKRRAAAIRRYFVGKGYAYSHSIDVNDFYLPAAGGSTRAWMLDALRYLRHRFIRRIGRFRQLAARSWRKRVQRRA